MAGRPFEFPDPKDRSINKPHDLVERDTILALYNQANVGSNAERVSETVKVWFESEAKSLGWLSVTFANSAAVLEAKVELKTE